MKKLVLSLALVLSSLATYAQDSFPTPEQTEPKYELAERDRRGHFVASETYIKQANVIIANYTAEELPDGQIKYTFKLPNGTIAAIGMMKHRNMGKLVVETMLDKRKHTVGLRNLDEVAVARERGMFLSDNRYI